MPYLSTSFLFFSPCVRHPAPPMQPPMHEQHEQAYEQNAFMKAESLNGQQS